MKLQIQSLLVNDEKTVIVELPINQEQAEMLSGFTKINGELVFINVKTCKCKECKCNG